MAHSAPKAGHHLAVWYSPNRCRFASGNSRLPRHNEVDYMSRPKLHCMNALVALKGQGAASENACHRRCLTRAGMAGYRVGGRHQEKDKTEKAAAGQHHDEVSQSRACRVLVSHTVQRGPNLVLEQGCFANLSC